MTILEEYGSVTLELPRPQAEALARTGVVDVRPAPGGRWQISAGSKVGSLVVGDLRLFIRPKIRPENLFLLLEPGLPASAWREEALGYDTSSDLLPAFIGYFSRAVETALGRGVLRSYVQRQEPLVALRGRMDVTGQFTRAGVVSPVACDFDEFTEDILENRILRAAIRLALRVPYIGAGVRRRLMQQLVALEGVADVPMYADVMTALRFTRLNRHYRPALRLAGLVLANLTLVDNPGAITASTFVVDMNDLFQRFVTERLRRELRGALDVHPEPQVLLDVNGQVQMNPDLVFRARGGQARHVGDVKYKLVTDARGRSSDYYQLLAYTTALDLQAGILIYCRRRGDEAQRPITVKSVGKTLHVRAIDLSGSHDAVQLEITQLAQAILETVATLPPTHETSAPSAPPPPIISR